MGLLKDKSQALDATHRVMVVGGNGFIGRHVVQHLTQTGVEVLVFDMISQTDRPSNTKQIVGSITDETHFASAVTGCQTVVFLANSSLPGSSPTNLSDEIHAHVHATVKAAELCRAAGVQRFLFASSGGTVYGYSSDAPLSEEMSTHPRNAYGVSKLTIEHYLRILEMQGDMKTVSLRISNPYGEGQRAIRNQGFIAAAMHSAISGQPITIWGDGSVQRDFIHVSDLANAFVAAIACPAPPQVANIGSGQALSLLDVIRMVECCTGRELRVHFEPGRAIDVKRNVLNIRRARETLGWQPRIAIDEGLRSTAKWWMEQA
ncbi:NAD-dependent epimerase/dehydratase family protein [Ruixingdingia sedimenti]|uniref:NAD-dependent epimerase/dehydratase family protein n=1 Tax=Ruixingdingia sedimenti TaxID=3073604 RepID=A0ABU1FEU0_9RHOB|nr:NAD-dependent epimerase/dehydratase family protein [Xinfangfangia sp. LG-4]MDR5655063.1 NAD-dependent epimerase/dehydratase family protein [Xinfangfangia sp. LG-4]